MTVSTVSRCSGDSDLAGPEAGSCGILLPSQGDGTLECSVTLQRGLPGGRIIHDVPCAREQSEPGAFGLLCPSGVHEPAAIEMMSKRVPSLAHPACRQVVDRKNSARCAALWSQRLPDGHAFTMSFAILTLLKESRRPQFQPADKGDLS